VSMLAAILMLALLGAVLSIVLRPLTTLRRAPRRRSQVRADLDAMREAKYQEIRDAELDYRMAKLSQRDHEAVDGALRREALEILDQIRRLEELDDGGSAPELDGGDQTLDAGEGTDADFGAGRAAAGRAAASRAAGP
jgi:hypothetical protein